MRFHPVHSPIPLFLVARDARLIRALRALDEERMFDPTRFSSLTGALRKAKDDPSVVLIVQRNAEEISEQIDSISRLEIRDVESRIFFYVPDLPTKSRREEEEIRLALLQIGATAVFSQLRELPALFSAFRRASTSRPVPAMSLVDTIRRYVHDL